MKNLTEAFLIFIAGMLLIAIIAVVMSYPIMWLWNACLVPAVDGVNEITVLQALGLNVLVSIMFVYKGRPADKKNND